MAKNKNSQSQQKISPERYIRENGRKLPVYECIINENWEQTRICNIIVAREHKSGSITCAGYMVDLLCIGIKDSFYKQNISIFEYKRIIEDYKNDETIAKIEYPLAHNIIFAGHDFAMDLNIKPCKIFSDVTKYLLEEDNDDIELIDIECGEDGIPVIFKGYLNIS